MKQLNNNTIILHYTVQIRGRLDGKNRGPVKDGCATPIMLIKKFRFTDCVLILQSLGSICGKLLMPGSNVTFHLCCIYGK